MGEGREGRKEEQKCSSHNNTTHNENTKKTCYLKLAGHGIKNRFISSSSASLSLPHKSPHHDLGTLVGIIGN